MVVKPKQAFLDWVRSLDPAEESETLESLRDDCNAYLIPEYELDSHKMEILNWCFEAVFQEELYAWHVVESDWPQQRDLEMFLEWFDVEFHSLVFDLDEDTQLEHNDYGDDGDDPSSNGHSSSGGADISH